MDERLKVLVEKVREHILDSTDESCIKFIEQCVEVELGHFEQHPCDSCEWQECCDLDDNKCELYL